MQSKKTSTLESGEIPDKKQTKKVTNGANSKGEGSNFEDSDQRKSHHSSGTQRSAQVSWHNSQNERSILGTNEDACILIDSKENEIKIKVINPKKKNDD